METSLAPPRRNGPDASDLLPSFSVPRLIAMADSIVEAPCARPQSHGSSYTVAGAILFRSARARDFACGSNLSCRRRGREVVRRRFAPRGSAQFPATSVRCQKPRLDGPPAEAHCALRERPQSGPAVDKTARPERCSLDHYSTMRNCGRRLYVKTITIIMTESLLADSDFVHDAAVWTM